MSSLPDVRLTPASGRRPGARPVGALKPNETPARDSDLTGDSESDLNQERLVTPAVDLAKLPDSDLSGDRVTAWARAVALARHWSQRTSQVTSSGGVFAAQPESLAQHRAYVRSRAWLPEGYDRGWLVWVTVAYYNTLGTVGVAVGYAIAWLFGRVLHFNVAVTVAAAATLLWLIFG